ncbi:MAG: hypothetical protein JO212_20780 [Acetobacteraceae bacterium]|nr:hypothetical protein [Acetobacteraceae bacterium]
MSSKDAKQELISFLERRAFQPVLRARQDDYPDNKRDELADLQERTRREIERFHNYGSAEDVVTNFKRDLHSSKAKEIHKRLEELNLPTINDVGQEFEEPADRLGVKG